MEFCEHPLIVRSIERKISIQFVAHTIFVHFYELMTIYQVDNLR